MADPGPAVFLSYASQDAGAARRICEALQTAGVEVWFDQSELVGGDAWDGKIRGQISSCALFVPVISANTQARLEGYFRLEWKLAALRTHTMADEKTFLLPVVIDATRDAEARVPAEFKSVQWTKLPGGETPPAFCERVKKLLVGEGVGAALRRDSDEASRRKAAPTVGGSRWWWWALPIFGMTMALLLLLRENHRPAERAREAARAPAASSTEARDLIRRARALSVEKYDSTVDDYAAAEALMKQALNVDSNDGEVWAFSSVLNKGFVTRGFDRSPTRLAAAREQAERALKLAPDSIEAQYALGYWQRDVDPAAAEQTFRHILERQPDHPGSLFGLSNLAFRAGHLAESQDYLARVGTNPIYAPLADYLQYLGYFNNAQFEDAERVVRHSIALQPSANSVAGLAMVLLTAKGDADGAAQALASGTVSARNEPRTIWMTAQMQLCQRKPDDALNTLDRLADDFIRDSWFTGPKAYWVGRAHALAGRPEAARIAWQSGLATTESRLEKTPENRDLHLIHGEFLALLGRTDEAIREARAVNELDRGRKAPWFVSPVRIFAALGRADDAMPLLAALCPPKPGGDVGWPLTPALLRLDPLWDKIRDDPRFRALAADAGVRDAPAAAGPAPDKKSIAVLAFANMSGDKDNEYFSDGISEEVLNVLAKVPGLKVTARTSAFYFKGRGESIAEIARQLGVAYIVEGSVRRAGSRVRITAELIKAADGFQVWSDDFDRELKDVFAVQDEIAALVARNLQLKLADNARPTASIDPEAYQFYLQGRQALLPRNVAGYDKAEKLFVKARDIAPQWAPVYAGLADVYRLRSFGLEPNFPGRDAPWPPNLAKAKSLAEQARSLDPNLPDAYVALGGINMLRWNLPEAETQARHAFELNPNESEACLVLGRTLVALGRMDEAIDAFYRGVELNPLAPRILDNLSAELNFAGRYDEGWKTIQRAAALQPDGAQIQCYQVRLLANLGRRDEALQMVEKLTRFREPIDREMGLIEAAAILARYSRQSEAEALVAKIPADAPEHTVGLAYLGKTREALDGLDNLQFGWSEDVIWGRSFDPIRTDPRFIAFLERVGLVEAQARATAWRIAHGIGPGQQP